MKKKLFVFDVDGTLYDLKHHVIPASTIQAIKQLKNQGHYFVIASGRAHYGLGKALMELQPDYILAMNGAVVTDADNRIISSVAFMQEDVDQIIAFAHEHDAGLVFKFIDHYYIYQYPEKVDWLPGQLASDIGEEPFIYCDEQNRHLKDLPFCASLHAPAKLIEDTFANYPSIDCLRFSQEGFDMVTRGMNKGVGLTKLMEKLHLLSEDVIAFGDNYNDIQMMQTAGFSVAMGNGVEAIKEIADMVTTSTNEDGIYLALKKLNYID